MRLKMFADGREILDSGDVYVSISIIIKQTNFFRKLSNYHLRMLNQYLVEKLDFI